jgi:hypothetical protein
MFRRSRERHAEQQPIVGMARIVDSVLVDDERADQSTELDQRMPVAAITGKTRRLDREHSADTAVADRCEQPRVAQGIGITSSSRAKPAGNWLPVRMVGASD